LLKGDGRDCERCNVGFLGEESPRLPAAGTEVLDPITAYQITTMLQGVVQRGTAAQVSSLGRPLAGKTGTTNEYRSAWFVGYSPEIVVGVFVGFDDNRSLGNSETGGQAAVPIFIEFMQTALRGSPYRDFQPPKTAKFVLVNGIREAFRPGTEPKPQLTPEGPVPYGEAWGGGPAVPPPPPPPKVQKVPEDLSGLY
jgi:penicillin-binding protein 1A